MRPFSVLLLAIVFVLCSSALHADPFYSYSYQGPQYQSADPYYRTHHFSISVDLEAPPPLAFSEVTPLFWSISDGLNTFTSIDCLTHSCTSVFRFAGDLGGNLTMWALNASITNFSAEISSLYALSFFTPCPIESCVTGDQVDSVNVGFAPPVVAPGTGSGNASAQAFHNYSAPPWIRAAATSVPEPISLLSLSLGFIGVLVFIRSPRARSFVRSSR